MNGIGLNINPGVVARTGAPSQAQVNQQAAAGGGTLSARDSFEKVRRQKDMSRAVNPKLATAKLAAKAKKVGAKGKA